MRIKNLLFTIAFATIATASFGQAPKNDRQAHQTPASNQPRELHSAFSLFKNASAYKAAQAYKLLPDSLLRLTNPELGEADSNEKIIFQYNAAGNLILETSYGWDPATEQWKEGDKTGYDDRGNRIFAEQHYIYSEWDEETQSEIKSERGDQYLYAYDHLNWQTLSVYYSWENEQWAGPTYGGKREDTYTDNANLYIQTETEYSWQDGAWQIFYKFEYTYAGQREMREPGSDNYNFDSTTGVLTPLPAAQKPYPENLLAKVQWFYDNGVISGGSKTEYTTNAKGYIIEEKNYSWNTTSNDWDETDRIKTDYTYDAQNLLTGTSRSNWDAENNVWEPEITHTITYTFDSNNNVVSWTKASDWDSGKAEYTYDSQNRALTANEYNLNSEEWVKQAVYERTFDNYGNVNSYIEKHNWHEGVWQYESKSEFTYDSEGRTTMNSLISTYRYEDININGNKSEYAYDTNGNQTLYIYYDYDASTQTFVPRDKYESTYGNVPFDGGNNQLTVKDSKWEDGEWVVETDGKYEWTFDDANNPLSAVVSMKVEDEWIWYGTMTWYYSQHEVGIKTPPSNHLRVWISGNELKIENYEGNETVQIVDIAGKLIVNSKSSNGKSIDVSHLPKGVYIVKVGKMTEKLVK